MVLYIILSPFALILSWFAMCSVFEFCAHLTRPEPAVIRWRRFQLVAISVVPLVALAWVMDAVWPYGAAIIFANVYWATRKPTAVADREAAELLLRGMEYEAQKRGQHGDPKEKGPEA